MAKSTTALRRRYGVALERVRVALKMTHVEMTALCGCGRMTYYRWERGQVTPPAWLTDALDFGADAYVEHLETAPSANDERARIRSALAEWDEAERDPRRYPHPRLRFLAGLQRTGERAAAA